MLKYYDIISKLSDSQKIRVLTNVGNLSGKDLKILGIPTVKIGNMKDYGRGFYPHAASMSHSWDKSLWSDVAKAKLVSMVEDEVNFVISPAPKIKISPYRKEMTEDSYLSSVMAGEYAGAVKGCGAITALSGYYLTEADIAWMDKEPSERVIREEVILPYLNIIDSNGADAVLTDTRALTKEYATVAEKMRCSFSNGFVICNEATDENTVELVSEGVICLSASANALDGAYTKYKKLAQQAERGAMDESAVIEQVKCHVAISQELIDKALDRVLEFLFLCYGSRTALMDVSAKDADIVARQAAFESSVLLKNRNGILPLIKDTRIAVVGDLLGDGENASSVKITEILREHGYSCTDPIRGYNTENIFAEDLADNAVKSVSEADVIVLVLGVPKSGERKITKDETLALPANQLYLAHKLEETGKRIIGVVSSAYSFDVEFSRGFDALLSVPLESAYGYYALADIITGEYNPSGKLAYTLFSGSDAGFAKRALYKSEYGLKSGPFIGYKYYDTAGLVVGYPFGHGLSYSKFQYSSLSVSGRTVTFEIRNTSSVKGVEVAEIYIGKKNSSLIRPKRELCGFERVELMAGESRVVSVNISIPKVYYDGKYIEEGGEYELFVGSSVSDIRLHTVVNIGGAAPLPDGERMIDYIQSLPNIIEDKFTLEADFSFMKKSYKNITFGIGALALALGIAVFNTVMDLSSTFLGIVSAILAIASIALFIIEMRERNRLYEEERAKIDEANKEHFAGAEGITDAEEIAGVNATRLFHDEFDSTEPLVNSTDRIVEEISDENVQGFIDSAFTMASAVTEFLKFALEHGYKLVRSEVENLFASFASSKLIVTSMDEKDFNECIVLLSEYFGCNAFVDNYSSDKDGTADAFYSFDANGDKVRRNILLALSASTSYGESDKVHISALNGVKCAGMYDILRPFMRYINAPKDKNDIEMFNEHGVNVGYTISPNFWIVINVADGECLEELPVSVVRAAALNSLKVSKVQPSDTQSILHGLNRHQLAHLSERARARAEISEDVWRKIDRLEKYAQDYSDYSIGNKLWLNLESHIATLVDMGVETADAVDMATAARLLGSVSSILAGKLTADDKSLADTVEFIFGADNASFSKAVIKGMLTPRTAAKNSTAATTDAGDTVAETNTGEEIVIATEVDEEAVGNESESSDGEVNTSEE